MEELAGRLMALDPEAGESLKVVAYFDALVAGGVGLDGLLRGAAALSGVAAGAEVRGRVSRRDPEGHRLPDDCDVPKSLERHTSSGTVWLERAGAPYANDEMITERLALAVDVLETRRSPESAVEVAIDSARSTDERRAALTRLRLDPGRKVRIVATSPDLTMPGVASAVVATTYGMLRASVDVARSAIPAGRVGLGPCVRADHAPESWESAQIAFRLSDTTTPVVDATDLGAMLMLARVYDPESPHGDVRALARLDVRSSEILRVLVGADSIRGAAAELGMHHSTVQNRHEVFTEQLGYDPRSAAGRMRYFAAAFLLRLTADTAALEPRID
ncbi:helix-turn-helix domain-containing protein [Mycobacterium sp. MUNTM1]